MINKYVFWQFKICKVSFVKILLQWHQEIFDVFTFPNIYSDNTHPHPTHTHTRKHTQKHSHTHARTHTHTHTTLKTLHKDVTCEENFFPLVKYVC